MHTAPARAPRSTASATADADSNLKPAHDFTLATFEGDTFTLSDHFGELPVVLNFWAPW
jgi:thiol-disulfide isomerase/thioredoxin